MEVYDLTVGKHPILTSIARSYMNEDFIAERVFPEVKVDAEVLDIPIYDKSAFRVFNTNRGIRSDPNIIPAGKVNYLTVKLQKEDLTALIDRMEMKLAELAGDKTKRLLDIKSRRVKEAKEGVLLSIEAQAAQLVQNPSSYSADNTLPITSDKNRFDADTSDPQGVIQDCKKEVRAKIAKEPNTLTMSYDVYSALKNHVQLRSTGAGRAQIVNVEVMKEVFEVENIFVGAAVYVDGNNEFQNIWNNNVVLTYQPKSPTQYTPSFCQTLRHRNYPYSKEYWKDNEKEVLAVKYADLLKLEIIGKDAGFLIIDAIA